MKDCSDLILRVELSGSFDSSAATLPAPQAHIPCIITGVTEWRDDLKKALKQAGGYGRDTTFLFTEDKIKEDVFLQDIDSLLKSGEVPNLYAVDERQEIVEVRHLRLVSGRVLAVLWCFIIWHFDWFVVSFHITHHSSSRNVQISFICEICFFFDEGFVVYQVALGSVSLRALLSTPCHFHSVNSPYSSVTSRQLKLILATSSTIELHT